MVANWCVQNVQTSQEIKLEFHAERNIAKVMVETESMRPNDRSFPFFPGYHYLFDRVQKRVHIPLET